MWPSWNNICKPGNREWLVDFLMLYRWPRMGYYCSSRDWKNLFCAVYFVQGENYQNIILFWFMLNSRILSRLLRASTVLRHLSLYIQSYSCTGTIGLARLAVSYLYKDEFHLEPSTVSWSRRTSGWRQQVALTHDVRLLWAAYPISSLGLYLKFSWWIVQWNMIEGSMKHSIQRAYMNSWSRSY